MPETFKCAIVTPTVSVLDEEVNLVEFPQWDGQRGILAGAAPFVAKMGAGRLRIDYPEGGTRVFLLAGGFADLIQTTQFATCQPPPPFPALLPLSLR